MTDRPTSDPADPQAPDAAPAGPATVAEPGTELVLVPPAPVAAVTPGQAATVVPVDDAVVRQLETTADAFADSVVALDVHSPDFTGKVGSITRMGDRELRDAAAVSNRMLERPVKAMGSGLFDASSPVSRSLIDLRNTVEELDPARQGDLFSPRKLLGMIPLGSKLRDYFDRYRSSQTHLDAIINALYRGQDELRKDNAAIEQEKVTLWATMGRLQQYALLAARLDEALEDKVAGLEAGDPDRARVLRQDVQFYVRQKHQDLLTQLAVAVQGYLALDLVRKNNHELIKGVDRATTTTVAALRTAVLVAQALANQRLVLDQITALNTTTGNLIESTSSMLRQQTGRIHDQAASATINLNQLKTAFANIYATMEAVDTYKGAALQSMRATVDALETEVGKARGHLERAKGSPAVDDALPGLGTASWPCRRPPGGAEACAGWSSRSWPWPWRPAAAPVAAGNRPPTLPAPCGSWPAPSSRTSSPWSAMRRAYQRAQADADADKGSFTSIVVMTDGENNRGISVDDFLGSLRAVPEPARSVKSFAIQFGEANPDELRRIVQATSGAMFDANASSLAAAFKEIRGYQ